MKSFTEPTSVVVDSGETFEVVLGGNFTTGFRWELDRVDDVISLISEEMRAGGDAPGSAGTQHFQLAARSKGSYSLRFVYRRPWEDSIQDERDIDVSVS